MKLFLTCVFLWITFFGISQDGIIDLTVQEKELYEQLSQLRKSKSDKEIDSINQLFKQRLHKTILIEGAIDYPFLSLKTLGTTKSPDNLLRLFNWNIEYANGENKYFCYILWLEEKKNEWKITELVDNSAMLPLKPTEVLDEKSWYGALYYKIIPVKKSNKTYYTLLGWDGNDNMTNIKLIDVLYFSGNHVKLGYPFFDMGGKIQKRVFFEYSERAFMSLNYDDKLDRIIFDHLAPESPSMEGFYEYYVPDLSNDALIYEKNKWYLIEDIVAVNSKNPTKVTVSYYDEASGEVKQKEMKNKWISPGNTHVSALPELELKNTKDQQNLTKKDSSKENQKSQNSKKDDFLYPQNNVPRKMNKRKLKQR
jgi:hypothetical protein